MPGQAGGRVLLFFPILLERQNPLMAPLELLSLAVPLRSMGLEVRILDQRLERLDSARLRSELDQTLLVGVSCRPGGQVRRGFEFARQVKSLAPQIPVVMGGWFPTVVPERVARHPAVDYVIAGEGEKPLAALAAALLEGRSPGAIPGLARMKEGRFELERSEERCSFAEFGTPAYDMIDLEPYLGPDRELTYVSSKGCEASCKFCAIHCEYRDRWHPLPAERVVREVVHLAAVWRLRQFRFVDANFFADEERARQIAQGFLQAGLKLRWQAAGRADQLLEYRDETWELIARAGCRLIEIGAESGNDDTLLSMDKGTRVEQTKEFAAIVRKLGIIPQFNFILGYPGESLEGLRNTLRTIHELRDADPRATFALFRFAPIPNTVLHAEVAGAHGAEPDFPVEDSVLYASSAAQKWLPEEMARIVDMLFYCYLPFSLRRPDPGQDWIRRRLWGGLVRISKHRVRQLDFRLPIEWRALRLGTRLGLLDPQRFRQWVFS